MTDAFFQSRGHYLGRYDRDLPIDSHSARANELARSEDIQFCSSCIDYWRPVLYCSIIVHYHFLSMHETNVSCWKCPTLNFIRQQIGLCYTWEPSDPWVVSTHSKAAPFTFINQCELVSSISRYDNILVSNGTPANLLASIFLAATAIAIAARLTATPATRTLACVLVDSICTTTQFHRGDNDVHEMLKILPFSIQVDWCRLTIV